MIFNFISQREIRAYFKSSFGYSTEQKGKSFYIYSTEKKGHGYIYLRSRRRYWLPYLYFLLWLDREQLNLPLKVEWYRFLFHCEIDKEFARRKANSKSI